ncbi:hypothetical protein PCASD_12501 [Puccinia coronata f. sp. avenae]|uniref:Uncharacterized protein n=1 Tax=Puccinia coronata f. sp. avenae TaxID=200324 RepID=A0A2N5U7L7_9BASI|nr:hypothetical protein PCASD_12501 [Puccinia coronata f. sp. avenae]
MDEDWTDMGFGGWRLQAAKASKSSRPGSFLSTAGMFGRSCSGSVGGSKKAVGPLAWPLAPQKSDWTH